MGVKGLPPTSGGDDVWALSGFKITKVPTAVKAAYLPIFLRASLRVILSWLFSFVMTIDLNFGSKIIK